MTALHIPRRHAQFWVSVQPGGMFFAAVDMGTEWPHCETRRRTWCAGYDRLGQMVTEILDCNFPAVIETPLIQQLDDASDWYFNAVIWPQHCRQWRRRIFDGVLIGLAGLVLFFGFVATRV